MAGGRVYGGSNLTVILQNKGIPCSTETLDSLLISSPSPRFHGSRSMVSFDPFEDACGNTPERPFYRALDQEEGNEDLDECFHQPEKKRRLTSVQVQLLERNFEVENKLEPDRKIQLAKDLGLQPRQVAIWFQNRRARWKTKQLEKDYGALKASYDSLKSDYDILLKEKEKLKTEVAVLTDRLKENVKGSSEISEHSSLNSHLQSQRPAVNSVSDAKQPGAPIVACKQEELSSATSAIFDSDSPHYTDGGHSSRLDHSDFSHTQEEEEDQLSKTMLPLAYHFPKLEDTIYPDPPASSCNYGFPVEDQSFWFWP
ncbi:uncharacterized protein LOC143887623 [Tasmannia lanceolata]|uniref:uncharacterized protein LOC143887623 n=1 Tax=Tasmannia lanceolata TaxID=3420 RepID=UPI0040644330